MTYHSGSLDLDPQKKCVVIAIGDRGNQPQPVPRSLSFGPKLVATAAEKRDVACRERTLARLAIHKTQHQHFAGRLILHNRWRQTLHLVKINYRIHEFCLSRKNKKPAELESHQRAQSLRCLR